MFQGHFDLDGAIAVEATAIPDVLFERGLYWASGRSGVVNLVAAHKWFNLAALKGCRDAIAMRDRRPLATWGGRDSRPGCSFHGDGLCGWDLRRLRTRRA